jgi:hypothetical protein
MFTTFEYRLYPNHCQREALMACLKESRHLYKDMVERIADYYVETGRFLFLERVPRSRLL